MRDRQYQERVRGREPLVGQGLQVGPGAAGCGRGPGEEARAVGVGTAAARLRRVPTGKAAI